MEKRTIQDSAGRDHEITIHDNWESIPKSVESGGKRFPSEGQAVAYCKRLMRFSPDATCEFHIMPWISSLTGDKKWSVFFA